MGGKLHLLVVPLGSAIDATDYAHPVEAPEVSIDEGVATFGFGCRPVGQPRPSC